jgi:hypothetical protein
MPTNIKWELLDYAYLQPDDEETMTRSGETYQLPADVYSAAIDKSIEITGNGDSVSQTRASKWSPSGSIKYMSGLPNEPNPVPLAGVYVRANTTFNTGNTYTNSDGTFKIGKGAGGAFRNKVHYMVIWYRSDGKWKIHDGVGKADTKRSSDQNIKAPWNPVFGNDEFGFCAAIHRALYAYFYGNYPASTGLYKISSINIKERWGQTSNPVGSLGKTIITNNNPIEIYGIFNRKNANGNITGTEVVPTQFEVLAETIYQLGNMSFVKQTSFNYSNNDLPIAWCIAVQHAYMSSIQPSYRRDYYSSAWPAIGASLLRNGVSLAQLQTIMIKNNPYNLSQCRVAVKALGILPASKVDQIFDNPANLY